VARVLRRHGGERLYGHGTVWDGAISSFCEKEISVTVEGFLPATVSQAVLFSVGNSQTSVEHQGKVKGITVETQDGVQRQTNLGHMKIQIAWPPLDELTFFKVNGLLRQVRGKGGVANIEIKFLGEPSQDDLPCLLPTGPIFEPPSLDLQDLAKASHPKLVSSLVRYQNDSGKIMVGYHDCSATTHPQAPVVVLAPGYGETKREYITLGYYLASNGFHVLRYDHTHHVGESEGSHENTSLTTMKQDLGAILDCAKHRWPQSSLGLVASSLAGRVALKGLAEGHKVDHLIVINGIVDVRSTLQAVHQEDLIGQYLQGSDRGMTNVLGFNVNGRIFLKDAVDGLFSDVGTTIRDATRIRTPVLWFAGEQDAWVDQDSLDQVLQAFPTACRSFVIPEGLHRLQEHPRKARGVYRQIIFSCQEHLGCSPCGQEIIEPSRKEIGHQNRLERERNHVRRFQQDTDHLDFWDGYLSHFHYITNSHDYLAALDHIYHLLGTISPGERVLDAGCGNGHFGSFLVAKEWIRQQHDFQSDVDPIQYVGVDFVASALNQAEIHLRQVLHHVGQGQTNSPKAHDILQQNFYRLDLNTPLPFKNNSFDRIMSNLVIGYLRDPAASIRELLRVLVPGGRLVLTNLKPCSDLTQIYRNFVDRNKAPAAIHEAREVLNNSSHIRQGESEGAFQFYSQEEFLKVLQVCGAENPRVFPTFGNQAYIGVIEKPAFQTKENSGHPLTLESLVAA